MKIQRQQRSPSIAYNRGRTAKGQISQEANAPTINAVIEDSKSNDDQRELTILDINDSGMGITCPTPLKVGQHILFDNQNQDWDLPEKGIVMWTFKASYKFRAGIKFI